MPEPLVAARSPKPTPAPPVDPPAPPVPADPIVSSEGVHFDRFDGFGAPYDAKHDRP